MTGRKILNDNMRFEIKNKFGSKCMGEYKNNIIRENSFIYYFGYNIFIIKEDEKYFYKKIENKLNNGYEGLFLYIKKCGTKLFKNSPIHAHVRYEGQYNDVITKSDFIKGEKSQKYIFNDSILDNDDEKVIEESLDTDLDFSGSHDRIIGKGGVSIPTGNGKKRGRSKAQRRLVGENHRFCDPINVDPSFLQKYVNNKTIIKASTGRLIYIDDIEKKYVVAFTKRNFFDKIGQDGWGIIQKTNKNRPKHGIVRMVRTYKNVVKLELFLWSEENKFKNRIKELKNNGYEKFKL